MQKQDLAGVLEIENENLSPWTPDMLASELEVADGSQFVVEDAAGRVIGWCCGRFFAPEAELLRIAVARTAHRTGAGSQLLKRLCFECKKKGVTSLFLEVRAQNSSAREFYKENGFLSVGLRTRYYSDPGDDALVLRKELL